MRYALPGEEVLVAVRTDEDVRLMFEEWDLWLRGPFLDALWETGHKYYDADGLPVAS